MHTTKLQPVNPFTTQYKEVLDSNLQQNQTIEIKMCHFQNGRSRICLSKTRLNVWTTMTLWHSPCSTTASIIIFWVWSKHNEGALYCRLLGWFLSLQKTRPRRLWDKSIYSWHERLVIVCFFFGWFCWRLPIINGGESTDTHILSNTPTLYLLATYIERADRLLRQFSPYCIYVGRLHSFGSHIRLYSWHFRQSHITVSECRNDSLFLLVCAYLSTNFKTPKSVNMTISV